MKAVVVGLGSIGTRHAKNLLSLGVEVAAVEPNGEMRTLSIEYADSIAAAKAGIACICSPTSMHMKQAIEAAKGGMHVFIEKPPSDSLEGFSELGEICREKKLVAMVACNFRFAEGLKAVKKLADEGKHGRLLSVRAYFGQYLPSMRKGRDYRTLYAAGKAGGVVLDSFHEFDYLSWFLGEPKEVKSVKRRVSRLEIEKEDVAEVIMDYGSAVGSVHVNYLRGKYKRGCEFIFDDATAVWDYRADEQRETVEVYKNSGEKEVIVDSAIDVNSMYVDEMRHFLECVKAGKKPILGLGESAKTLKTVLKVLA